MPRPDAGEPEVSMPACRGKGDVVRSARRLWRVGLRGALGVVMTLALLGVVTVATTTQSGAQGSAPFIELSTSSGPVGTKVEVYGSIGRACTPPTSPTAYVSVGLHMAKPTHHGEPWTSLAITVGPTGAFAATFVIPPFLHGGATFGPLPVLPGTNYFFTVTTLPARGVCGPTIFVRTPFTVTGPIGSQPPGRFSGIAPTPTGKGYWLSQVGGGVYSYGDAGFYGSLPGLGVTPATGVTGITSTPTGKGYWMVSATGGVYAFGSAGFYGSLPGLGIHPYGAIVGIAPTPTGGGYWLVGATGGVFAFGDAGYYGNGDSMTIALSPTSTGEGYTVIRGAGQGLFPIERGDAATAHLPSGKIVRLGTLLTDGTTNPSDTGYWLVGVDGGVFSFGTAPFYGSLPGIGVAPLGAIVGIAPTPTGGGYWLVGSTGGVFAFGDAGFYGSAG